MIGQMLAGFAYAKARKALPYILVILAILAVVFVSERSYGRGYAAAETAAQIAALEIEASLRARIDRLSEDLAAAQALDPVKIERLENEAMQAPGADRLCLDADGVQRLRARWASK